MFDVTVYVMSLRLNKYKWHYMKYITLIFKVRLKPLFNNAEKSTI